ncbi:MAG: glycosyltransferase [Flavobacteriales bacterium]|nr:glycosyltransferase [Flavobacteriales bacterium]
MKILFVANRVPYPPFRGDKLKIYNLARRLSANNDLYLITFAETKEDLKHLPRIREIFKEVHIVYLPKWKSYLNVLLAVFSAMPLQVAYFRSRKMKKRIRNFLKAHPVDVVHTQHLRMAPFTRELNYPKILDLPDAFSLYWKRRLANRKNPFVKMFEQLEFRRLYEFEGFVTHKFNSVLVCSAEDKEFLEKEHKSPKVNLLRNGVDLDTFKTGGHDYRRREMVLFTGNMDYAPNVDAVLYFSKEIWPLIRSKISHVKFVIAGQRPVNKVLQLACEDIEVTGFVPNLNEMYESASVVVSPLRFGAGTQNKVLEAMAMGVPVVSGPIGFKGLEILQGEGVFMEIEKELFAQKVIELLESEKLRKETGEKGRKIAIEKFSWDRIANTLEGYFKEQVN